MADLFKAYQDVDAALVDARFEPTSGWWLDELRRFFSRRRRRWIIRVGRRGGKSSTLCRLAVVVALFGDWSVPLGDIAVVAIVSVKTDEAAARLRTIRAILEALGFRSGRDFDERGTEIELRGERSVLFKVFPCNVDSVGFTSILVVGDEVARWESRDTGANPAREVIASLAPTMATQPSAFMVLSSSPWSVDDFHATSFDEGDTDYQMVSYAPTWIAHPAITEDATHELEPDERVWSREYAAIPGATVSAALDPADWAGCFGRQPLGNLGRGFLAIDASSLRGDGFAWVAGRESDAGEVVVLEADAIEGAELRNVSMRQVVERIARRAGAWDVRTIFGDQREEASLRSMFAESGVALKVYSWTEQSKDESFQLWRRLLRDRLMLVCDHEGLRREGGALKAHLLPSGRIRYQTNGLDYASALLTLLHAVVAHDFRLGPANHRSLAEINAPLHGGVGGLGVNEPPLPHHRHSHTRWAGTPGRGFG